MTIMPNTVPKVMETAQVIQNWVGCTLVCATCFFLLSPMATVTADSGDLENGDPRANLPEMDRGNPGVNTDHGSRLVTGDPNHVSSVFPIPRNHKRTRISHINERQTQVPHQKTPSSRSSYLGTSPDYTDSTTDRNRPRQTSERIHVDRNLISGSHMTRTFITANTENPTISQGKTWNPSAKITSQSTIPGKMTSHFHEEETEVTSHQAGKITSYTTDRDDPTSDPSAKVPQTTISQSAQLETTEWGTNEEVTTDDVRNEDHQTSTSTQSDIDRGLLTTLSNLVVEQTTTPDIVAIVKALQTQFKESRTSQVRTRSVLYEIQEKQLAQEADLFVLKNQISEIRRQQEDDHTSLEELRAMVSDNNWALADLKSSHNQFKTDIRTLKHFQEEQNETVAEVDDLVVRTDQLHQNYRSSIGQLQRDMHEVKKMVHQDRIVLNQIKQTMNSSEIFNYWTQSNNGSYPNRIRPIPGVDSMESSGESVSSKEDALASKLEETDNTVGHQKLRPVTKKIPETQDLPSKFVQYDADFAKMYAMFYNLSLQVSALQNRLLVHQQQKYENDMNDLQHSLANFTQQMFHLEKWRMTSRGMVNTSSQNEKDITHMNIIVENHTNRIRTIEQMLLDQRASGKVNYDTLASHFNQMNETLQEYRTKFTHHHDSASDTFENVDDKLARVNGQLQRHDDRLAQVEVRVLNATLQQCQKANTDLVQDMKLSSFSVDLDQTQRTANENLAKIARIDRGVSRLFQDLQSQGKTVTEVMDQMSQLLHLVSDVSDLQYEVHNFVQQLPPDCEMPLATHKMVSGTYLITPDRSTSSARTYCQVEDGMAWTLIQQRSNGSERFSRTWMEYKKGFGEPAMEFWIGNDNLHYLTTQQDYLLHIDMWDINGNYRYADYNFFKVDEESTNFRLHIDGYSGNATDALKYSNFMPFSTIDRDNDVSSTHCAKFYTSGWWYKHCHYSNLNGRYTVGIVWFNHETDEWLQLRKTVMKIRPLNGTSIFT